MKKILCMIILLGMVNATGCQNSAEQSDSSAPDLVITLEETTEPSETEVPTTEETTASETIEETVTEEIVTESEPAETITETLAETNASTESEEETAVFEAAAADEALLGEWQYENGFRMRFYDENEMIMFIDYTGALNFEDGYFTVYDISCAVLSTADAVTAVYEGETILHMTPAEGNNAMALQGLYQLEPCYLYEVLSMNETGECYLLIEDQRVYAGFLGYYNASDGEMQLFSQGDELILQYEVSGDTLRITDENMQTDILTKIS